MAQTKIKASDLAVNGDSFFDGSNITSELNRLAQEDGVIGAGEKFRQIARSGAVMSGIVNQYKNANPKPIYIVSDGGGNDFMGSCGANPTIECASIKNALTLMRQLFELMRDGGTKQALWFRYPDPQGSQWATLKTNQDLYNPEVEKICKASVVPKCLWVDLRPVWSGKPQYTSDGIHATNAGGTATAEAAWKAIKENDFFNLDAITSLRAGRSEPSFYRGSAVVNGTLLLSLSLEQPRPVTLRIRTLSGRTVVDSRSEAAHPPTGLTTVRYVSGEMRRVYSTI
ncbi:MAG: SGNH/GDSL hydrolase family protein [Fibrobacteria bacterium]